MDEKAATLPATLPFSEEKQLAALGHLVVNDRFFGQLRHRTQTSWWLDPYVGKIYLAKAHFHEKYNRAPTVEELHDCPEVFCEADDARTRIHTRLKMALEATKNYRLDALSNELTQWLHSRIYYEAVHQSAKLYNAVPPRPDDAYSVMERAMREIRDTTFHDDPKVDWSDYRSRFARIEVEYKDALTWGVDLFDQKLTPAAVRGSLLLGDTTVLLAPTNIGKTTTVATICRHNIVRRKPILFITHEGRENDIFTKIWCCLLKINQAQLLELQASPEGQTLMDRYVPLLMEYLDFIHMPRAGGTVEHVIAVVRKAQEERIAKHGVGYSMLVDDYPACLTTAMAAKGNMAPRHIHSYVYDQFVDLGLEYNFHVLLPIQTNREGSKVNAGEKEDRLLTKEDVHEAFGPMQRATNIITINRDPLAQMNNRVTYFIDKSRSSETKWAIVCKSAYDRSMAHDQDLGATCYRGTATMSEQLDNLLAKYKGQCIPDILING